MNTQFNYSASGGKGLATEEANYVIKRIREFTGRKLSADEDMLDQLIRESSR